MWFPLRLASASGSNVPMWKFALFGVAMLTAAAGLDRAVRTRIVPVHNLPEARSRLEAAGFHCVSDEPAAGNMAGFQVSRTPSAREEVARLRKSGPMTAAWKGKAWVTVSAPHWNLALVPEGATVRAWGHVVAFGDEQVMRELDEVLASPCLQ
jgi:hypothetical protein